MANSLYVFKNVLQFEPFKDNAEYVKLLSDYWRGVHIDTWHIKGDSDYQQMVGYIVVETGNEVVLGRRDIPVMEMTSLEFHNVKRQFYCDLINWSFHGLVDNLDYALTPDDLTMARTIISPFPPADGTFHSTLTLADSIELYGKEVHWLVTSRKLTRGQFEQTVDFFVDGEVPDTERHFIINPPDVEQPFLKVGNWFEKHEASIINTLGLDKDK